ncbi:glycosyltransferase family 2 protein [Methylomicrobium lacus]|uniref:glycosyltransferase family 2 protein n=1 Tax=Methylomicrobium lacus TaxID=136992 RepID=UPI0035A843D3
MTLFELSIIIVNWNSKDYLRNCIASILANSFSIKYEIIVVDSASFDGCGDMLQHLYPQVHFIQSEFNVGFARANNIGASCAHGNVLLFLNPDTEVRGHAIENLYCHYQDLHSPGVVGCRLLNSDGTLQTSCVQPFPTILNQILDTDTLLRWFPKITLWNSALTFDKVITPVTVEMISGACMMIERDVFNKVGQFSADYFMYAEEFDLCYKTTMAGFNNYFVPTIEIIHYGGGSTQNERSCFSQVMMREAVFRQLRKTRGSLYSLGYRLAMSSTAVIRLTLLTLFFPVWLINYQKRQWDKAFNKWFAIFRWSIGLEKSLHDYN